MHGQNLLGWEQKQKTGSLARKNNRSFVERSGSDKKRYRRVGVCVLLIFGG